MLPRSALVSQVIVLSTSPKIVALNVLLLDAVSSVSTYLIAFTVNLYIFVMAV